MKRVVTAALAVLLSIVVGRAHVMAKTVEITPFTGFHLGGALSIRGMDFSKLDIEDGPVFGASIGIPVMKQVDVELAWSKESTTLIGGPGIALMDLDINQFHFNFLYTFSESFPKTESFVLIGAGFTQFTPDSREFESARRFSFGIGGGIKIFLLKNIGLRLQASWKPILVNRKTEFLYSDRENEYYALPRRTDLMTQWEFIGGVIIRI